MLSDPGSVDKSKPILLSLDLSMLPSAIARASATPSQIYEAQSLRLLPTACLFLCLRITHVVPHTSPKLDPRCSGYRFLERTLTSGNISASWRTAKLLGISHTKTNSPDSTQWGIGIFKGKKHASHLVLLRDSGGFKLILAGHDIALIEVLSFEGKTFKIDKRKLTMLVDNPAAGGGNVESAGERKERLTKRKNELKNRGQTNFLKIIAEEEGISDTRVKQILSSNKKNSKKDNDW